MVITSRCWRAWCSTSQKWKCDSVATAVTSPKEMMWRQLQRHEMRLQHCSSKLPLRHLSRHPPRQEASGIGSRACPLRVQHCPSIRITACHCHPDSNLHDSLSQAAGVAAQCSARSTIYTQRAYCSHAQVQVNSMDNGCWQFATLVSKHTSSREPMLHLITRILKAGNQFGRQCRRHARQ